MAKESNFLYLFYIFLGLSGSTILPIKFVLQDDFKIQPVDFELIFRLSTTLWMIKFIVGFIINPVINNILYYKILLTACLITNSVAWGLLSSWSTVEINTVGQITALLFVVFSTLCVMDVGTDGRMVKHVLNENESDKGNTQTYAWGFRSFGRLIGGVAVIILVHRDGLDGVSPQQFLDGFVIIPLIYIILLWGGIEDDRYPPVQEKEKISTQSFCTICKMVFNTFKQNNKMLFFMIILFITPSSGSNMYLYLSESIEHHGLGFDTKVLGIIGLVDAGACVLASVLYKKFMRKINLRWLFGICIVVACATSAAQLVLLFGIYKDYNISAEVFVVSDDAVGSIVQQLIMLPLMIIMAHCITPGFETVLYSAFTSLENVLSAVSSFISAAITSELGIKRGEDGSINFDKLWIMLIITTSTMVLPLFFLKFIPPKISSYDSLHVIGEDDDEENEEGIELTIRARFEAPCPEQNNTLPQNGDVI